MVTPWACDKFQFFCCITGEEEEENEESISVLCVQT